LRGELSFAQRARVLLDVVAEFDTDRREAGEPSILGGQDELSQAVKRLDRLLRSDSTGSDAGSVATKQIQIGEASAVIHYQLAVLHHKDSLTKPSLPTAANRLKALTLLGRHQNALVDFEKLRDAAISSDAIRTDAQSVGFPMDDLKNALGQRREDILASVSDVIGDLRRARSALGEFLRTCLERDSTDDLPPTTDVGRLSTIPGRPPLVRSADDIARRIRLEAALLEVSARADQVVAGALERSSRSVLSGFASNLRRTELQLASAEGLAQVIDERLEIRTVAADRLIELMRRMKGGSIGLAGTRGAGKSTLMRRLRDGREKFGDRDLLAVMVPAPVVYDSREFMLHLFAEICRAAGASPPPYEPSDDSSATTSGLSAWALATARAQSWWLPLPALWLVLGGAAALVSAVDTQVNDHVVWGVALLLGGLTAWCIQLTAPGQLRRSKEYPTYERPLRLLAVLALTLGVGLIVAGVAGLEPAPERAAAISVIGIGFLLLAIARNLQVAMSSRHLHEGRDVERAGEALRREWLHGDELTATASIRLAELRYQQSLTLGVSGKIGVPLGVEIGASAERTLARHPMTFPEVVADLQRFLSIAAKTRDVLIAIDELDKLEADDDTANRFLNDLKAAFGVPNTYFLVSVSDDAMSRFERRGMPFRDVFDSTFDEIVSVQPLSLNEAQRLLSQRIVGFPFVYSALCHALAGGNPRDLIRLARRVVEVNDALGKPDTLATIVSHLVRTDLEGKVAAVERAVVGLNAPDEWSTGMLEWVRAVRAACSTEAALMNIAVELRQKVTQFGSTRDVADSEAAAQRALRRLMLELGTYGYFAATSLAFFKDSLTSEEIEEAANGARTDPTLERLASARRGFTVSARTAWIGVNDFRSAVGIEPNSLPVPTLDGLGAAG